MISNTANAAIILCALTVSTYGGAQASSLDCVPSAGVREVHPAALAALGQFTLEDAASKRPDVLFHAYQKYDYNPFEEACRYKQIEIERMPEQPGGLALTSERRERAMWTLCSNYAMSRRELKKNATHMSDESGVKVSAMLDRVRESIISIKSEVDKFKVSLCVELIGDVSRAMQSTNDDMMDICCIIRIYSSIQGEPIPDDPRA
jgi:hypothetical protein